MPFRLFARRSVGPAEEPYRGRRFVVGDIHGCARTFRALVDGALSVRAGDTLYLLGDLISKGPDSRAVLSLVLELRGRGVRVELIRGNHEDELIRYLDKSPAKLRSFLERTENTALLDTADPTRLDGALHRLIAESQYYLELPEALLSHAGFDFDAAKPFKDTDSMLNTKSCSYDEDLAGGRLVIHGHVPTPLSTILETVVQGGPVIPLDNRVVSTKSGVSWKIAEYGNLCAFDLDERTLHVQPNIENTPERAVDGRFYNLCVRGIATPQVR